MLETAGANRRVPTQPPSIFRWGRGPDEKLTGDRGIPGDPGSWCVMALTKGRDYYVPSRVPSSLLPPPGSWGMKCVQSPPGFPPGYVETANAAPCCWYDLGNTNNDGS